MHLAQLSPVRASFTRLECHAPQLHNVIHREMGQTVGVYVLYICTVVILWLQYQRLVVRVNCAKHTYLKELVGGKDYCREINLLFIDTENIQPEIEINLNPMIRHLRYPKEKMWFTPSGRPVISNSSHADFKKHSAFYSRFKNKFFTLNCNFTWTTLAIEWKYEGIKKFVELTLFLFP